MITNKWKKKEFFFLKEEEEEKWLFDTRDVGRLCMLISLVSSLWREREKWRGRFYSLKRNTYTQKKEKNIQKMVEGNVWRHCWRSFVSSPVILFFDTCTKHQQHTERRRRYILDGQQQWTSFPRRPLSHKAKRQPTGGNRDRAAFFS